jgi:putative Mg2+ transporter-C (MgtC) family protein
VFYFEGVNGETVMLISYSEIIFRLFLASILGGVIGIEREKRTWFAGLRTHMLVCIGSTLIMIVSQYGFRDVLHSELVILDPSRVAAQVVSGMGFLGAGTILFWKNKIRGLTTAASLWAVSGVGLSVGGGLYLAAVVTTALIFTVLSFIKPLEVLLFKKQSMKEISFSIKPRISLVNLEEILMNLNLRLDLKNLQIENEEGNELIHLTFNKSQEIDLLRIAEEIKKIEGVEKVEIIE